MISRGTVRRASTPEPDFNTDARKPWPGRKTKTRKMAPLEEIVDITGRLIRFASTHDRPEEIRKCVLFVSDWLKSHGIRHHCHDHGGYLSLAVMPESNHVPVLLMTHLDVVDAPRQLFTPRREGDILWGRGSIDDKYAVALSLVMLKEFLAAKPQAWPLGLLITSDEEIGGQNGAARMLPAIGTQFGIALDGGAPDRIIVKEKGILKIRLRATGISAHGSRPWLGKNAIDILIEDIMAIKGLFEYDPDDSLHWHRTCNVGLIKGGKAANQVPDRAEAVLDVRFTENDDPDKLVAQMQALVKGKLEEQARAQMFISLGSEYLELLRRCVPEATLEAEHGSSDARYLTPLGIDGVVWGADGRMSQHSDREHVLIPSIGLLYKRLAGFIRKVAEAGL